MKRGELYRMITELEADESLKEVLRAMVNFVDEEDEVLYGKLKKRIERGENGL